MNHLLPFTAYVVSPTSPVPNGLNWSLHPYKVPVCQDTPLLSGLLPQDSSSGKGRICTAYIPVDLTSLEPQIPYLAKCGRSPGHREVSLLTHVAQPEPHLPLSHTQSLHKHILNRGEKPRSGLGAGEQETAKGPAVLHRLYTGSPTSPSACLSDRTEWELRARLRKQNWLWLVPILPHA